MWGATKETPKEEHLKQSQKLVQMSWGERMIGLLSSEAEKE